MNPSEVPFSSDRMSIQNLSLRALGAIALGLCFLVGGRISASDHSDAPRSGETTRQDGNLTDLHAFRTEHNTLVISLCADPAIPPSVARYLWSEDITFEFNIDVDSKVSSDDPLGMGGTMLNPSKIKEDVRIRVHFHKDGKPHVQVHGAGRLKRDLEDDMKFFAGLRDDPFIRGPRQGRNVVAIVLELPIEPLIKKQDTLLIWATSKVDGFQGPFQEIAGRSLRSMFPENNDLNGMSPEQVSKRLGVVPDVMIYDTSRPAAYPNGRALEDDVVDLVGDQRVLGNDAPFPSTNDKPFLTEFPYLSPPHDPR